MLGLLTSDREFLKAKAVLEKTHSDLGTKFTFEMLTPEGWLFQHILREKRSAWVGGKSEWVVGRLRTSHINRKIGKGQFFLSPLVIEGKGIGIFYADRQVSGVRLDIKTYDAFVELCNITNETIQQIQNAK